ncbi:hypothetical protein QZH41_009349 [Actinostola sp. cb2023]|nr:hypothetical protein QZH41_009349 [Actinostola sp. cb2023]
MNSLRHNNPSLRFDREDISTRQRSIELLMKIFPNHSSRTLDLFLQSCRENIVETIECVLTTQRSFCPGGVKYSPLRAPPIDGCTIPTIRHSSPFIHVPPVPRGQMGMPLTNLHSCSSTRIYQPLPLPPPLLIKPKSEIPHFRLPTPQRPLPATLPPRNCGMSQFCTSCGNKMTVYDKFCSSCGKGTNMVSPS